MTTCGPAWVQSCFWSPSINCIHVDVDSITASFRNVSAGFSAKIRASATIRRYLQTQECHFHLCNTLFKRGCSPEVDNHRLLCLKDFCSISQCFVLVYAHSLSCMCLFVCLCDAVREWEVLNDWASWTSGQSVQSKFKYIVNKHCSVSHWHCKLAKAKQGFLLLWASQCSCRHLHKIT